MSSKGIKQNDTEDGTDLSLSSEEALRLIQRMERLGFIEINMKKRTCKEENIIRPMCELLIVESKQGDDKDPILITMNQLVLLIESQLTDLGGRMTITSHSSSPTCSPTNTLLTRMIAHPSYFPFVLQAVERLCQDHSKSNTIHQSLFPTIQRIGQPNHFDLITCEYMDKIMIQTFHLLERDEETMGRIMIADLARKSFQLPTDFIYTSIQKYLKASSSSSSPSGKQGHVINQGGKDGAKQLLSPSYIQRKKQEIYKSLQGLKVRTVLDLQFFKTFQWDVASVANYIRSICTHTTDAISTTPSRDDEDTNINTLDADIHMIFDSNYIMGEAVFIPTLYTRMQREKILEYYSLHGYITFHQCLVLGISKSRLKDDLMELLPDATHFSQCCVNEPFFIAQIQAHLVPCIHEGKYLDLSPFLPFEFLSEKDMYHHDAQRLVITALEKHDEFHGKDGQRYGILVSTEGHAMYYSTAFIQSVEVKLLPLWISSFVKRRAQELSAVFSSITDYRNRSNKLETTSKSKKISGKNTTENKTDFSSSDVVSVDEVVNKIADEFSDLGEIQNSYRSTNRSDEQKSVSWYDFEEGNHGNLGPLHEFCKLLNRRIIAECQDSVRAELERIFAMRKGLSLDGLDNASKLKRAIAAFEDVSCFTTACHFIQLLSKLPIALSAGKVSSDDSSLVASFEYEFLRGPASDFTMRLTQFCLYKHGFTNLFFFTDLDSNQLCDRTDLFTDPVDLGVRFFRPWSLSCKKNDDGTDCDPLKLLRDVLPQAVGEALSRLWQLTSSHNSSSMNEFMRQIIENCLLVCGIPFKLLDKKSEKQVLLRRMNELHSALERSSDPVENGELIVMIVVQKMMGFVVCGKPLQRELLQLLISTNKVPEETTAKLVNIETHVQDLKNMLLIRANKTR